MITFFSIPKPFTGHIDIIQRNAIRSWMKLVPAGNIILFGSDFGVAEVAKEYNVRHYPDIEMNEFGTPLVSAAFNAANKHSDTPLLVYLNADIILFSDFVPGIKGVVGVFGNKNFLVVGRRHDLDVDSLLPFSNQSWEQDLRSLMKQKAKLHRYSGIDYFVFPRDLPHGLPPFAVGRPGWDNWFIYNMRMNKIPVVDATEAITVVHQNHVSAYNLRQEESIKNIRKSGGLQRMCTILDASVRLTRKGVVPLTLARLIFVSMSLTVPVRLLLAAKRHLQNYLGCK